MGCQPPCVEKCIFRVDVFAWVVKLFGHHKMAATWGCIWLLWVLKQKYGGILNPPQNGWFFQFPIKMGWFGGTTIFGNIRMGFGMFMFFFLRDDLEKVQIRVSKVLTVFSAWVLIFYLLPQFSGWWFQRFFMFTPTWGNDPIWLICFRWVATTK